MTFADLPWTYDDTATPTGAGGRKCRRHEWQKTVAGIPWPARCGSCSLVTEDPDAYFYPASWDPEMVPEERRCPGSRDGMHDLDTRVRCVNCPAVQSPEVSRRSRNNRKRGQSIEREVCEYLGWLNIGGANGPADGIAMTDLFIGQVKSGGRFPGWMANELAKLPRTGGRIPVLAVAETPGPGHKRRVLVVVEAADWVALHGNGKP